MKTKIVSVLAALAAATFGPALRADNIDSLLLSSTDPTAWSVSVHTTGIDVGDNSGSFITAADAFVAAVSVTNRGDFIANNPQGRNGGMYSFTQFVFRQTFDLSGYDASTAVLRFQWAADDIPTWGIWDRGNWVPRFKLNGGSFQGQGTAWYDYTGTIVTVQGGFTSGLNTIDFYVQGNGETDGFAFKTESFTADRTPGTSVPDSGSSAALTLIALVVVGAVGSVVFRTSRKQPLRR